ncbi:sigma-70 family RNA polymerase sigma factor [Streptomyces shenzhenensis]|uniref:sigma-70 family RNA polymerase sigma factor n=1 Tax=Streptomyces shenzhenensis TaxID=943815 RepID=UPI00382A9E7E
MEINDEMVNDARHGSAEATTAILRAFDGRIRALARRISPHHAEDVAQAGSVALWRCLDRFSGNTVAEFAAYADATLRGAMRSAHLQLRYPGLSHDESALWVSAVKKAPDGDWDAAHRLLDSGELRWRASADTAGAIKTAVRAPLSLDKPVSEDDARTVYEVMPSEHAPAAVNERAEAVALGVLALLGRQQREVLARTYGMAGHGRMADDEIAAELGISRKGVIAARSKAHRRMREDPRLVILGSFLMASADLRERG